jgi:NADH-quinone oxidoreductase subunit M
MRREIMSTFLQNPLSLVAALLAISLFFTLTISAHKVTVIRYVALTSSLTALFFGVLSCLSFDKAAAGFQFLTTLSLISEYNLSFTLGADGLSMTFLLLTLFIFPILFLAS